MSVDLHCHSLFSVDGYGTPEELIKRAALMEVETFSITEHNNLDSHDRAFAAAQKAGIKYIAGVEFDVRWRGRKLHCLALGVDPGNHRLQELCRRHMQVYAHFGELARKAMAERGALISEAQWQADLRWRYPTHPAPVPNVWHLRDFYSRAESADDAARTKQILKSIMSELRKSAPEISEMFGGFEEVRNVVHEANGIILLAHVAKYLPGDLSGQIEMINRLIDEGLDGFELFHPENCKEMHFDELKRFAFERDCLVSGGSDAHLPDKVGNMVVSAGDIERLLTRLGRD